MKHTKNYMVNVMLLLITVLTLNTNLFAQDIIYGITEDGEFGSMTSPGYAWSQIGSDFPFTSRALAIIDATTGIAKNDETSQSSDNTFFLINLVTGATTTLTKTNNAAFNFDKGAFKCGAYDRATNTYYASQTGNELHTFTVDKATGIITFVSELDKNGNEEDYTLYDGMLYGIKNEDELFITDPATGTGTTSTITYSGPAATDDAAGTWTLADGTIQYMDKDNNVFTLEISNPAAPVATKVGTSSGFSNLNQNNVFASLYASSPTTIGPTRVNGAALWLKADAGLTGNAAVSQWNDQSGNSNHATQATPANQPNGVSQRLNFNPAVKFDSTIPELGRRSAGANDYYRDRIAEVVFYKQDLDAPSLYKIHSYLALKYGATLNQSTPTNYIASDGTSLMWDANVNTTYNDDVFGIGKDETSLLEQFISNSENINSILTVSSDTDFTSENSTHTDIFDNLEFVTHANNANGAVLSVSSTDVNASLPNIKKVNREWNIQEVGDVACVNYKFDVNGLTLASGDVIFAVIAEDAAFTTNVEIKQLDNTAAEFSVDWDANSTTNYLTLAKLAAADKDPELTDVKVGVTILSSKPMPTTSNTYLELASRDTGFVITRLSTANRTSMTQQPGLFVFDTDLNQFFVSNGTLWRVLGSSTSKFCN